jgi:hypothetical protein
VGKAEEGRQPRRIYPLSTVICSRDAYCPAPTCVGAEMANVEPENLYPSAPLIQKAVETYESGS